MRATLDEYKNGVLFNGYDYTKQTWVKNGKYIKCGHPKEMNCNCYGRKNEGKETE